MSTTQTFDPAGLSPELQDYYEQNEAVVREAEKLVAGLTPEQLNWQPGPKRWSIGDCLHHLNVVTRTYIPIWAEAIERARADGKLASGPFRYGWFSTKFVNSLEPPVKLRVKTPGGVGITAGATHEAHALMEEFRNLHDRLKQVIADAEGVDLRKVKISSVANPLLRLPLGQWFRFNASHDRRHIWQARNVMKEEGFPGGS